MASKICAKYWVKIESFDHVHVIYPKKERSSKVNLCRSISPMNSYADRGLVISNIIVSIFSWCFLTCIVTI